MHVNVARVKVHLSESPSILGWSSIYKSKINSMTTVVIVTIIMLLLLGVLMILMETGFISHTLAE